MCVDFRIATTFAFARIRVLLEAEFTNMKFILWRIVTFATSAFVSHFSSIVRSMNSLFFSR